MKNWKNFIKISCLLMLILGYHTAEAQETLAQEAYLIFEQNCFNCHGPAGVSREALIIEHTELIATGVVVPGKLPIESELYRRLREERSRKTDAVGSTATSSRSNWDHR